MTAKYKTVKEFNIKIKMIEDGINQLQVSFKRRTSIHYQLFSIFESVKRAKFHKYTNHHYNIMVSLIHTFFF